ncbi:MAG: flagellin-like protein [bacterium]|jgi:flagellin-like protein
MKEQIKKIDPKLAPTKALYKRAENPTIGLVILVQIIFL